jgi:hypothetical protein
VPGSHRERITVSTHPPNPHQAFDPYGRPYAPPAPRNGFGVAAIVLGLVAVPFLISGLTAPIAIVLGLIAVPLALVCLGRVRRHEATNRGATVTGLILGVAAVVLGVAAIAVTVQAVDDVLDGPTATVVGEQQIAEQQTEVSGPILLGAAVDVDGLVVNVTEIVTRTDYSKRLTCANVTYENRGDDVASRNPYDWSARNPHGASLSPC